MTLTTVYTTSDLLHHPNALTHVETADLALLLAAAAHQRQEVNLTAVTTTYGNAGSEATTGDAQKLFNSIGLKGVPLARPVPCFIFRLALNPHTSTKPTMMTMKVRGLV